MYIFGWFIYNFILQNESFKLYNEYGNGNKRYEKSSVSKNAESLNSDVLCQHNAQTSTLMTLTSLGHLGQFVEILSRSQQIGEPEPALQPTGRHF